LGLLLGIWTAFSPRLSVAVLAVVSVIQTVPTLALLGLLIVPLSTLGEAVPPLARLGLRGIGPAPTIAALTLYSLLPIVRNTYTSLREVDPSTREAGLGMGLTIRAWASLLSEAFPLTTRPTSSRARWRRHSLLCFWTTECLCWNHPRLPALLKSCCLQRYNQKT
jgi:osmoprotectant transport system permease protein